MERFFYEIHIDTITRVVYPHLVQMLPALNARGTWGFGATLREGLYIFLMDCVIFYLFGVILG